MEIIIRIGIFFLNIVYDFHKLCPTKNRISVISRQSRKISRDARMLLQEIKKENPDIETRAVYQMLPDGIIGRALYLLHMMGPEMHALATSRVVIVEGYCMSVSILKHKKNLKVVQMWHAMGALKKFGYLSLDEEEGSSSKTARAMHMHANYDYVLVSSPYVAVYYEAAFHCAKDKIRVYPLPRTDLLTSPEYMQKKRQEICEKYPVVNEKKNILYVPTFRKGRTEEMKKAVYRLIDAVDTDTYNLIIKLHPLEEKEISHPKVLKCPDYDSLDLLSVTDYVISDYSAEIFEAAVADKPIFFYAYDLEEYKVRRGFCIDYEREIPTKPVADPNEVMDMINRDDYDEDRLAAFREKYVRLPRDGSKCTRNLANFILLLYNEAQNRKEKRNGK